MQTIPETTSTVQFDTALRTLAAQARTRYAGEAARIDRALVIALNGGVTLGADGSADVQSCSNAEVVYHVEGGVCDCPDFQRAPDGRCKHRFAVCLVKKATQQVAEEEAAQNSYAPYYATYYAKDGRVYQGTAYPLVTGHWYFVVEATGEALYADEDGLVRGGRVDILEAQRQRDGDLVKKICGYA